MEKIISAMARKHNTPEKMERSKHNYRLSAHFLALKLINPHSKVLSVGCGPGREVKHLVQKLSSDVTAVDFDIDMITSSKEIEPKAEYICMDIINFEKPNSYDYIVCLFNTINEMKKEDRKKFIEVAYKSLRPNGTLLITTSNAFSSGWKFIFYFLKSFFSPFIYFPNQVKYWFSTTDFKIQKIKIGGYNLIIAEK